MPTEIEYALMSGHAYRTTRDEINWIPAPQGWNPFFHVPNPDTPSFHATSGFEAISFQRGTEIVISYAGTDPGDILGDIAADIGLASGVGSAQLLSFPASTASTRTGSSASASSVVRTSSSPWSCAVLPAATISGSSPSGGSVSGWDGSNSIGPVMWTCGGQRRGYSSCGKFATSASSSLIDP